MMWKLAIALFVGLVSFGMLCASVGPSVEMGEKPLSEPLGLIVYVAAMVLGALAFLAACLIVSGTL